MDPKYYRQQPVLEHVETTSGFQFDGVTNKNMTITFLLVPLAPESTGSISTT